MRREASANVVSGIDRGCIQTETRKDFSKYKGYEEKLIEEIKLKECINRQGAAAGYEDGMRKLLMS